MQDIFNRRFLIVAGKGGVGRSSVCAALALSAARRNKRVLIAMCNTKERLSYLLGVRPIGPEIRNILPNVDAVNMEPSVALREYGMMILRVRALYKLVLENRFVSAFLRGTPGLDAWALLGKAQHHVRERDKHNRPRYDLVILDAPATGHALDMLRVPRVIIAAAPPGLLRREAEAAWELFVDPARTGACLVTLPEELPTNETLDLYRALREELEIPVCCLTINQVLPRLFADEEGPLLERLVEDGRMSPALVSLARASRTRAVREAIQSSCIQRLAESIPVPTLHLPRLFTSEFRRDAIERLSHTIDAQCFRPASEVGCH